MLWYVIGYILLGTVFNGMMAYEDPDFRKGEMAIKTILLWPIGAALLLGVGIGYLSSFPKQDHDNDEEETP